jgi:hypothetical protein
VQKPQELYIALPQLPWTSGGKAAFCARVREVTMSLKVQALDHLVVHLSDVEASTSWYERVLAMTREDVPTGYR